MSNIYLYELLNQCSEYAYKHALSEFLSLYPDKKEGDVTIVEQWEDEVVEYFTPEFQKIYDKWYYEFLNNYNFHIDPEEDKLEKEKIKNTHDIMVKDSSETTKNNENPF